jgi:cytochrome oxidase Cu insertion factor (SCO1/SenC/PrrC family)
MRPVLRIVLPAVSTVLAILLVLAIVLRGSSSHTVSGRGGFEGAAFPAGVRAHDFTLEDQQGRKVSLSAYRGQVLALAFLPVPVGVSPECRTCVLVAHQVRGALDELESHPPAKPGVKTVFISTKPDAPRARVWRLLAQTSLTGRVEFLTGTAKELRPVLHAYSLPPSSAGKAASEAAVTVFLIDRNGWERVGFGLEQITPEGLSHDIRLLQGG